MLIKFLAAKFRSSDFFFSRTSINKDISYLTCCCIVSQCCCIVYLDSTTWLNNICNSSNIKFNNISTLS